MMRRVLGLGLVGWYSALAASMGCVGSVSIASFRLKAPLLVWLRGETDGRAAKVTP